MQGQVPPVGTLRVLCYKDEANYGKIPGISKYFIHPYISIYVTKFCLHCRVAADTITATMALVASCGALLLISQATPLRVLGLLLFIVSWILDHVDGEVLRYRRQSSAYGVLLDRLGHAVSHPLMHVCLGWSLGHGAMLWFAMGCANAIAILTIFVAELEARLAWRDAGPPPSVHRVKTFWVFALFRKAAAVYRGVVMLGYGANVVMLLLIGLLSGVLPYVFAVVSASLYFNVALTLSGILCRAYRTKMAKA
jgi:phosphatidylglycerophosphate synthase